MKILGATGKFADIHRRSQTHSPASHERRTNWSGNLRRMGKYWNRSFDIAESDFVSYPDRRLQQRNQRFNFQRQTELHLELLHGTHDWSLLRLQWRFRRAVISRSCSQWGSCRHRVLELDTVRISRCAFSCFYTDQRIQRMDNRANRNRSMRG